MKFRQSTKHIRTATWQEWMGQWAELISSGMSALDALSLSSTLLGAHSQGRLLRQRLERVGQFLNSGENLLTAFRAACTIVPPPVELALICAQASGDLGHALMEQLERWNMCEQARRALGKSLIYPGLVLFLAIGCWIFLHHVSAPHVENSSTALPFTWGYSEALLVFGLGIFFVCAGLRFQQRTRTNPIDFFWPKKAWVASNFYHVIACELNAGFDLIYCLRFRGMPNKKWWKKIDLAHATQAQLNQAASIVQKNLKLGMGLSHAMREAQAPDFLIRQSQLAEQTGNLAYCFHLAAKVYALQAKRAQERLQKILPPIALAIAAITLALAYQFTLAPLYSNLTGLS